LAFAGDKLYIADTNNQAIRILDLGSGSVTTLALSGLDTPSPAPSPEPAQALAAQTAAPGARELRVTIHLPEGRELNPQAPSRLELSSSDPAVARPERGSSPVESQTLTLPLSLHPGQATLTLHLTLFYCSHGRQALCFYKQDSLALPVTVSPQGAGELTVDYRVP
ncbi:MAG TPA: hypothetical protein VFR02_09065, partial [bacterium]|nr:hypothetical protein [bacterium]